MVASSPYFGLLGPVVATVDGADVPLGGPRARAVLAALLIGAGRVVPLDAIVAAAWGDDAPDGARFQSQNRVSALRRALREAGGRDVIETVGAGYAVHIGPDELDTLAFEAELAAARTLVSRSAWAPAADTLTAALARWRGPALHGLDTPRLRAAALRLDEARLTGQELLFDVQLRRGRHHEIVADLLDLVAAQPWRERPVGQLMLAYYRSGRRRDAVDLFDRTDQLLGAELGIRAGQDLVALRERILRDDPDLLVDGDPARTEARNEDGAAPGAAAAVGATPGTGAAGAGTGGTGVGAAGNGVAAGTGPAGAGTGGTGVGAAGNGVAAGNGAAAGTGAAGNGAAAGAGGGMTAVQPDRPVSTLPRAVPDFVGRAADLRVLDGRPDDGSAVAIRTISGPPGVGKTTVAVHWAHRAAARFPDGQLFVNLNGHGPGEPVRPAEALASLLSGLGLAPEQIPADEIAAAGRYRSHLAGRRVLVVLDNALDADQVRPLLPPGAGSVVLVTSRGRLTGLTAVDGARPLSLGTLALDDAVDLLGRLVGADRIGAEPEAARDLAVVCGRLPLALRITAAQLLDRPDRTLADHLAELSADPLTALAVAGDESAAVRPALARSLARLDPASARLFGLLGLGLAPDLSLASAAALAGGDPGDVALALDQLVAANLVERREPGRFALHDLVREYAAECAARDHGPTDRTAAVARLVDQLVGQADAVVRRAFPAAVRLLAPTTGRDPDPRDRAAALAWLDAEQTALVAVARMAGDVGRPAAAAELADGLRGYFWLRHDYVHWQAVARAALRIAAEAGDVRGEASSAYSAGMAELNASHYRPAIAYFRQAIHLSRTHGWPEIEASAFNSVGIAYTELDEMVHAVEAYARATTLNTELDRPVSRANSMGNLGLLQVRTGQFREAADHLATAVALHAELAGGSGHHAVFLHGLAQAQRHLGRFDEARASLDTALAACRDLDDSEQETLVLVDLAHLELDLGRPGAARDHADAAVRVATGLSDMDIRAAALAARATALIQTGHVERAGADADDAVRAVATSGSAYGWVQSTVVAAAVAVAAEARAAAVEWAGAARARARACGLRDLEGEAGTVLAEAMLADGDGDGDGDGAGSARQLALDAAAIHRETGHRLAEARARAVAGVAGDRLTPGGGAEDHAASRHLLAGLGLPGRRLTMLAYSIVDSYVH